MAVEATKGFKSAGPEHNHRAEVLDSSELFLQSKEQVRASGLRGGTYNLKTSRIKDIISFLSRLTLTVKARQVETTLSHDQGDVTGKESFSAFEKEECLARPRRHRTLLSRDWNFPSTCKEPIGLISPDLTKAVQRARNRLGPPDVHGIVMKLPPAVGVRDVMPAFGSPKQTACHLARLTRPGGCVGGELHHHSDASTLACGPQI